MAPIDEEKEKAWKKILIGWTMKHNGRFFAQLLPVICE